jgi:hypothetical protein
MCKDRVTQIHVTREQLFENYLKKHKHISKASKKNIQQMLSKEI